MNETAMCIKGIVFFGDELDLLGSEHKKTVHCFEDGNKPSSFMKYEELQR